MTTLDMALKEQRYLRRVTVLREMLRQTQLLAEGQSLREVAAGLGIHFMTVYRREKFLKGVDRRGINRGSK